GSDGFDAASRRWCGHPAATRASPDGGRSSLRRDGPPVRARTPRSGSPADGGFPYSPDAVPDAGEVGRGGEAVGGRWREPGGIGSRDPDAGGRRMMRPRVLWLAWWTAVAAAGLAGQARAGDTATAPADHTQEAPANHFDDTGRLYLWFESGMTFT